MKQLESLRKEIDKVDEILVDCLNRRFELSKAVGAVKASKGRPVLAVGREEDIRRFLKEKSRAEFEAAVQSVYTRIFEESRGLQTERGEADE